MLVAGSLNLLMTGCSTLQFTTRLCERWWLCRYPSILIQRWEIDILITLTMFIELSSRESWKADKPTKYVTNTSWSHLTGRGLVHDLLECYCNFYLEDCCHCRKITVLLLPGHRVLSSWSQLQLSDNLPISQSSHSLRHWLLFLFSCQSLWLENASLVMLLYERDACCFHVQNFDVGSLRGE